MFLITVVRWLSLLSVSLWFLIYWRGGRKVVDDIRKSIEVHHSHLDTILMVTIGLLSMVVMVSGLLMSLEQSATTNLHTKIAHVIGCVGVILGVAGMFYCRHFLGQFWTAETTLRQDHQVVDRGPYGSVRHPIYTFATLMYISLGLVFPTWWNWVAIGLIVLAYALKAWDEDKFLARKLAGYQSYRQRVRYRLFPGLF